MKNITIDSNILMDFLFKRDGHEKAAEIFAHCAKKEINGFICAHEITTLSYFLEKSVNDKAMIKKSISGIMKRFKVIEINEEILAIALHSAIDDFEDAVIEVSSKEKNVDYIITRNIKDFKRSLIKALTPEELLALLHSKPENTENKN
ncbi:MAG: PIN domain-containing protein [Spirochaetales bacterium]|jgi:predicted nucleic acid-binding protein|nr:PIN domain-containing protein [Spirochaetales bacterium]